MRQILDSAMCFIQKNIPCDLCHNAVVFKTDEAWWLEHEDSTIDHEAVIDPLHVLGIAKECWENDAIEAMHRYMWAFVVLDAGALNPEKAMESYKTALEFIV